MKRKIFILILSFVLTAGPASARRIREKPAFEPAGFVEPMEVDSDWVLDTYTQMILDEKGSEFIRECLLKRWTVGQASEELKNKFLKEIMEDNSIEWKIDTLRENEINRRRQKEARQENPQNIQEKEDLYLWFKGIVYNIVSRAFVQLIGRKIEVSLSGAGVIERDFLYRLQQEIRNRYLGVHYEGGGFKISDKFMKAIKLVTRVIEDGRLVRESFSSLFGIGGFDKEDILGVWVDIPGEEPHQDASQVTYQYRVTVRKDKKVYSAEFFLKLFISEFKDFDKLSDKLERIKSLSDDFPHVLSPGAWIRNDVEKQQFPFLAFTQRSLRRPYIMSLKQLRNQNNISEDDLINLETRILEEYLGFWQRTKRIVDKQEMGLLISVWPARVSVYRIGNSYEFRLVGIEHAYWCSSEGLLKELSKKEYNYHPQAIAQALKNIFG